MLFVRLLNTAYKTTKQKQNSVSLVGHLLSCHLCIKLISRFPVRGVVVECYEPVMLIESSFLYYPNRDKYLKPYVTSEPEITFTKREAEDECLILASDGLWDVISTEMACEVARECLREENPTGNHSFRPWVEGDGEGAIFSSQSASAAALLTRLALGRNSYDNISVIVVDLKRNYAGR
uniref:Probable protein phosphatase 2C 75 n=1 Tax=Nicotiana tabacum TaxID=4097 RepID=A0A1S3XTF9_TOBAC|nr:PREDICTED: probable protein phosphatase 2C 75 [Nicotiana tabacum]